MSIEIKEYVGFKPTPDKKNKDNKTTKDKKEVKKANKKK